MDYNKSHNGRLGGVATLIKYGRQKMTQWGKLGGRPLTQPPSEYSNYVFARGRDIGRPHDTNLFIQLPCAACGQNRWVRFVKGKPESTLCRHCAGYKTSWKGGRTRGHGGYIQIKLDSNGFFYPMATSEGYVFEHRLVMAKHLGRCLQPWEAIHHKDGNKANNDIKNLELTTIRTHISDHNKGYRDGYTKGLQDGRLTQIRQLKSQITELQSQFGISKMP